jgi:PAS domain S-box-containing protein
MSKLKSFFISLFTSNLHDKYEFEVIYKIVALNTLCFIGFIFYSIFGIYAILRGDNTLAIIDFCTAFSVILMALYLRISKKYKLALVVTISIVVLSFLYLFYSELVKPSGTSLWLYSFPLMIFFLLGNRKGLYIIPPFFVLLVFGLFFSPLKVPLGSFHFRFLGSFAITCIIAYFIELFRSQFQRRVEKQNEILQNHIAKLEKAEADIKRSEFRYRSIFENSGTAIICFGDDRIVRMSNHKFGELIGLPLESIIDNVKWSDFVVESDIERMENFHNLRSQGKEAPHAYEFQLKDMNGMIKEVLMNISIHPETRERTASMIDLTQQKLMSKIQTILYHISSAVNTSKDFFEFMQAVQTELSSIINTKNFYVALYDKEKNELTLPFHQDEKDRFSSFPVGKSLTGYVIKTQKSLLANREKVDLLTELGIVESIGARSEVWLGVPLIVKNEIIGVIAVQDYENSKAYNDSHREILEFVSGQIALATERKKAEEDLKREKTYLQKLFDSAPEGVVLATNNSIIIRVNKGFTEIFGYQEKEAVGHSIDQLISTPELIKEAHQYTNQVADGKILNVETKRRHKNGKMIDVSIVGTPIYGDEGQIAVYGIYRDISERKAIEARIEQQQEYLKLINKIMRHDLMNNLSVINSALKLYGRTQNQEFITGAAESVKKSVELITKMRELESLSGTKDELTAYEIGNLMLKYKRAYPTIEIDISGSCKVLANEAINSVFDNLISNAINHGGTKKMLIQAKPGSAHCILDFIDFGNGIPDEIKPKIFDENFKHGKTGNTGLGLFIVKKAIDVFHGEIKVLDNEPQGTIFRIKLQKAV